jgi:hypothetical protein
MAIQARRNRKMVIKTLQKQELNMPLFHPRIIEKHTKATAALPAAHAPYGAMLSESDVAWLAQKYKSFEYQVNTYVLFYDHGIGLLKKSGILGCASPAFFNKKCASKYLPKDHKTWRYCATLNLFEHG